MGLRYVILGLLNTRSRSGYDLSKTMDKSTSFFWQANQSQIYPELKKLKNQELVEMEQVWEENKPAKQIYSITDKGRDILREWLNQHPIAHIHRESFALQVFFSGNFIDENVLLKKIRGEKEYHQQRLDEYLENEKTYLAGNVYEPIMRGRYLALKNGIAYEKMAVDYFSWAEEFINNSPYNGNELSE